jgi:hypothetical protein
VIDPDARTAARADADRRPLWRDLPILIIIIAGLFHLGRGAEVDGLVFVTIGVALVISELRDRSSPPVRREVEHESLGLSWILLGALVCVGYGVLVGRWAPASATVVLAVSVPGLLILPLAWRVGPVGRVAGPGRAGWVWAVVMMLVCLWELISFLSQPDPSTDSYDHPTLSAILNPLFGSATVRSVVLIAWLAIGLWLARRLFSTPREGERP